MTSDCTAVIQQDEAGGLIRGSVPALLKDNTSGKAALAESLYRQHRPPASVGQPALIRTGIFSSLGWYTDWILHQLTWLLSVVPWLDLHLFYHTHRIQALTLEVLLLFMRLWRCWILINSLGFIWDNKLSSYKLATGTWFLVVIYCSDVEITT